MPMLDLYLPESRLTPEQANSLARALLGTIQEAEGLAGSAFADRVTWAYIHWVWADTLVSRVPGAAPYPLFRLEIQTLAGLLDRDAKEGLGLSLSRLVLTAAGIPVSNETLPTVWILFRDYAPGDWMAGPQAGTAAGIRQAVAAERRVYGLT